MAKITETEWIWHDGEFVRWADATVHVLSHSLQFGSSAFEGIRCYATPSGPAIFRLEDHLQRLLDSCKMYRMEVKYSLDELVGACCELVERNNVDACYLRPMVIRGYGASGMVPFDSPVEVYLPCWPWGAYLGDGALENGVDACVASWARMAPNTVPSMAKVAGNYLSGQLIKMEALRNGFAEGIALTPDGMLSEGSGQNLFVVHHGTTVHADRQRHAAARHHAPQHPRACPRHGHSGARAGDAARDVVHGGRSISQRDRVGSDAGAQRRSSRRRQRTSRTDHDAAATALPRSRPRRRRRSVRLVDARARRAGEQSLNAREVLLRLCIVT